MPVPFIRRIQAEADAIFTVFDFDLEVSKGNIPGHANESKFGRNTRIDSAATADIWDGGNFGGNLIWAAPTAARIHTIASTDVNDDAGGTGARTVRITGLVDWDTAESSEVVIMNTASPPQTANAYVIIHRMEVLTKGATSTNIGTITATAAVDGTVTAQINPDQGETRMAIYGVPSTQTAYVKRLYANMNKAAGGGAAIGYVDIALLFNGEPDVELEGFVVKHPFGLSLNGTSALTIPFDNTKKLPGPAIIKVQCESGTNNMDISAGFDLNLVDN